MDNSDTGWQYIRRGFFTGTGSLKQYPIESTDPDGDFVRRFPRPVTVTMGQNHEIHYELVPTNCICVVYADYYSGESDSPQESESHYLLRINGRVAAMRQGGIPDLDFRGQPSFRWLTETEVFAWWEGHIGKAPNDLLASCYPKSLTEERGSIDQQRANSFAGRDKPCDPNEAFAELAATLRKRDGKLARYLASVRATIVSLNVIGDAVDPVGKSKVFNSQGEFPSYNAIAKAIRAMNEITCKTGVVWTASESDKTATKIIHNP